jgi:hypothetical protein
MTIKKIVVGKSYRTTQGIGTCLRVGGTYPPTVKIDLYDPPFGVRLFKPKDVLEEALTPAPAGD